MKTLNLSVLDRIMLPQLLPQQSSKLEMITISSIVEKTTFSDQELSDLGLKDNNGKVTWTSECDVEYKFTAEQIEVLKNASRKADENKSVNRQNIQLIEKIDAI